MLESVPSISFNYCLLGKHDNYIPPNNVNTPNALTPSGIDTVLSNIPDTSARRSSNDTTNFERLTTKINSSSTSTIEDAIQNAPTHTLLQWFLRTLRWENAPLIL